MYDPRCDGADCDNCPLGPKGWLRETTRTKYHPVKSQVHNEQPTSVAAVAECPAVQEVTLGYPLAGPSGAKWNEILRVLDHKRQDIDLHNTISCMPPGDASGAFERMTVAIDRENKRRAAYGESPLKHPVECCSKRLLKDIAPYKNLIALGRTAAVALTGRSKSITAQRGDGFTSEDDSIKVMPTFHPAFVIRSPVHMQTVVADIGKAFRWFKDELTWKKPNYLRQPSPRELESWLKDTLLWYKVNGRRAMLVIDTETFILDPINTRILCFAIGAEPVSFDSGARVVGINLLSKTDDHRFYSPEDEASIRKLVVDYVLDNPDVDLTGHNVIGYDKRVIERYFYLGDELAEP